MSDPMANYPLPPPPRAGLGNTFKRPIVNFTIPSTAGPGEARTVIASVLPPPLDTYVVPGFGKKYRSGIIYYGNGDDTSYIYDCIVDTASVVTVARDVGHVLSGVVQENPTPDPLVQRWASGGGFISHNIKSDFVQFIVGDPPSQRQLLMAAGAGILIGTGADNVPTLIQGDAPIQIRSFLHSLLLTAETAIDVTVNQGDITLSNTINGNINLTVPSNLFNFLNIDTGGGVVLNGRNIGLGMKAYISAVANSAGIGAEAVVLTTPAMTFKEGRAYAVTYRGSVFPSNAATFHFVRVRKTNLAGAFLSNLAQFSTPGVGAQQTIYDRVLIRRTTGIGDLVGVSLALTSQHSVGTGTWTGAPNDIRYFQVEDIGLAVDYPNAAFIT